jgi:DNA repair exonuclease SbcCD ATPase subunit
MKKNFILSMIISFAMICSCQKQDSAAEQQLAQRKVELDAREDALIERLNALDEKVNALDKRLNALAENEKSRANVQTIPPDAQSHDVVRDPAEAKAERDRRIQEFRAQIRARIPDPSKVTVGDPAKQERPAPRQLGPEDLQRQWEGKLNKARMSGEAVFPAAEAGSPTQSPAVEATSPSPSPTP